MMSVPLTVLALNGLAEYHNEGGPVSGRRMKTGRPGWGTTGRGRSQNIGCDIRSQGRVGMLTFEAAEICAAARPSWRASLNPSRGVGTCTPFMSELRVWWPFAML